MFLKRSQRFKRKIFNRLLLTSSLIIIVTVIVLIVTITNYYSDVIIQKEMNVNARTLDQVEDYFSNKQADVNTIIRDLYSRGEMLDDISYALHNGYGEYLRYRLDKYSQAPSATPVNIDTYFFGYFNQDNDVNAVSLKSEDFPEIEYLFVYNYGRWNRSKVDDVKELTEGEGYHLIQAISGNLKDTFTKTIAINNPATLKKMGELTIYYSTEGLDRIIQRKEVEVKPSFFLLDDQGKILYSVNRGVPVNLVKDIHHETNEREMTWEGKKYYINSVINNENEVFLSVIPQSELYKLTFVRGTMWLLIALATIVAIIMTYTFMRDYSERINRIDEAIREVQKGNLAVRIPKFGKDDELTTIAESFNSMLDELNEYIEHFYVLNIKQQQAELKALQSQINPHFLFNTLEAIRMSAVVEGSKTSSKMIFHLSRLLRYSMQSKEMVPLHTEVDNVRQYLNLMQLQHPDKLIVNIQIPKEVENTPIQRLILQPLVENYIIHGFKKDDNDNQLEIIAEKIDNHIKIRIVDNGRGITEEKLGSILKHMNDEGGVEMRSIGMKNVHQRLKLKHGQQYGVSIQSVVNQGTIITITLPAGAEQDV